MNFWKKTAFGKCVQLQLQAVLTLVFELKRKFLVNSGNPGYTEHNCFLKALK